MLITNYNKLSLCLFLLRGSVATPGVWSADQSKWWFLMKMLRAATQSRDPFVAFGASELLGSSHVWVFIPADPTGHGSVTLIDEHHLGRRSLPCLGYQQLLEGVMGPDHHLSNCSRVDFPVVVSVVGHLTSLKGGQQDYIIVGQEQLGSLPVDLASQVFDLLLDLSCT